MKDKLVRFVNKRERRFSGGEPHAAAFHSRSYHRYFEGYSEARRIGPDGRERIERVYTGVYYVQALDKRRQVLLRLWYALGWLLAAGLFGLGATRSVGSNAAWFVAVFQALAVAALGWMLVALFNYLTAPEKRTVYDQRTSSVSLRYAALAAAVALALTALAAAAWLLLHSGGSEGESGGAAWLWLLPFPISGGICFGVHLTERAVPYHEVPSENAPDDDGCVIE